MAEQWNYSYQKKEHYDNLAQLAGAIEYTNCTSAEG